jgi:PST family polysaccharide transporter
MNSNPDRQKRQLDAALVGGVAWTAGAKTATQVLSWASVIIAAWVLTPSDFGIMELAGFHLVFVVVLAEFGIGIAVLQMREIEDRILPQLNTLSWIFGGVAYGVSVAAAAPLARFFRSEELELLIMVNSLAFFISALQAVPNGLLQRDMDFRRLSIAEAVMAAVQAVATVVCALAGMGYWSFVAAAFLGKGTAAIMTFRWRPVPYAVPRWGEVSKPLRFGLEVAAARILWVGYSQMDGIVIGRLLGESSLGAYRLAMNFASAPSEKIAMLLMRVTGPLFARIQDDSAMMKRYLLNLSDLLALTIFPLCTGLVLVAPEAVEVILGPKWAAVALPMQWLAAFMALRNLNSLMSQLLTSLRLTGFLTWMSALTLVVLPVAFYFAAPHGTGAVAAAWLVMSPVTLWPVAVKLFRRIDCGVVEYFRVLAPALIGSTVMAAAVIALRFGLPAQWPATASLGAQVATGGIVYCLVLWATCRSRILRYYYFLRGQTTAQRG